MTSEPRAPAQGALHHGLTALKAWREDVASALAQLRRWAVVNQLADEHAAARLAYLERRLVADHLAIAFVAEASRGKSALIHALFFADLGGRLLPAGSGRRTLCATEILHDPARPPSMRLLPIETRESPRALREFIVDAEPWTQVDLDPARPESLAAAFDMLAQTRTVSAAQAHNLGLPAAEGAQVEVPRWRYAIVNFPHPLLALGLNILDTPGLGSLVTEPELTLHRLPEADAIVFMLAADAGATPADLALWREHVVTIEDQASTRYVVLNKIDVVQRQRALRSRGPRGDRPPRAGMRTGSRHRSRADLPAVGAAGTRGAHRRGRQGARRQPAARPRAGSRAAGSCARTAPTTRQRCAPSRTRCSRKPARCSASRRSFVEERVTELGALHGKNQKLVASLGKKFADERMRLDDTRTALAGLRAVHKRHADGLAALLDPEAAREAAVRARAAVLASPFSAGINEAVDAYFGSIRERLAQAVAAIGEVRAMMATVNQHFAGRWGLEAVDFTAFPTDRFFHEIDRLEEHCRRDFRSTSSLLIRGREALAALFFDTVALQVVHVFEIAERDVRAWMNAFIHPLEAQVASIQDRARTRVEGVAKMRDADSGLAQRMEELQSYLRESEERQREWAEHGRRLASLLDVAAAPALNARR